MGFFNMNYLLFMIPGFLLSIIASFAVRSAYSKWSQVRNSQDATGLDVARLLKERNGLDNLQLVQTQGTLSDHYDPRNQTLALSEGVATQASVAAMAIAAHELGHAMQEKKQLWSHETAPRNCTRGEYWFKFGHDSGDGRLIFEVDGLDHHRHYPLCQHDAVQFDNRARRAGCIPTRESDA